MKRAARTTCLSIGIIAWNEQAVIASTLDSLFRQSIFAELSQRGSTCEVICVANGCTDRTPVIASEVFDQQARSHPHAGCFSTRVANLAERGKINAWNQFVHTLSARESRFLLLMDADILIHRPDTLWNMLRALETDIQANVSVDRPCKEILFKEHKSFRERLSLAASQGTLAADAQLCGQLYCIRAEIARNIYLPKDLAACEDGFIKALVCTDSLTHPIKPGRICIAGEAEHTFEAYTSLSAVFKNQKRQMIGQTIVHILVDDYLKALPLSERLRLAQRLRENDQADPLWLKRLISEHLARTRFFWRLYPGLPGQRFRALGKLSPLRRLLCFPAAAAGSLVALVSSFMAYKSLKAGSTDYWPRAQRLGMKAHDSQRPRAWELIPTNPNQE